MRKQVVAILALVALAGACNERPRDSDTGALDNERSGTDTVVQSETVKDTTVVEADTSIDVDTVKQTDNIDDAKDKE